MPFSLTVMSRLSEHATVVAKPATPSPSSASSPPSSSPSSSPSTPLSDSLALLLAFLRSPLWCVPLSSFTDAHCLTFDTAAEHPLQHTDIHRSYVTLCESLLSAHLEAVGLSQSELVRVCELGLQSSDVAVQRLIGEVLLVERYELFHRRWCSATSSSTRRC